MKIGFFTDSYLPQLDGVATTIDACVKALEAKGHEVYIIAPRYPRYKDKRKNIFRLRSIKFSTELEIRIGLQLSPNAMLKLARIDFDIIHGHSGGPITFLGWQIARLKNIPYVCTYHTLWNRYVHYFLNGKLIRPKVMEVSSRIFGNVCDCVIAPTDRVRKELVSYGIKRPIYVIPSGIDLDRFSHTEKGILRKKIGVSNETKILLFVGRLGKEKSVDFLIKSFALIHKKDQQAVLVIVGEGKERANLQSLAQKLHLDKAIYFIGGVSHAQMPTIYADADIFVFASRTETQGMVVLEALVSGIPVVAVKDAAFNGIIESNFNGFLTLKNVKDFSAQVQSVLSDAVLRKRLAENALTDATRFSTGTMVVSLEKIYEQQIIEHQQNLKWWRRKVKNIADLLTMDI